MAFLRYREVEKEKLPEVKTVEQVMHPYQLVGNLTLVAAISGIIGAKIFHNLENLDELSRDPIGALLSFSGLTMYGGLILGTFSVMWYGRKHGIKPLVLADATAPGLMLAYGTGRLGCQISGDGDWGIINANVKPDWLSWLPDWAWAYNYPNNVINAGIPIPGCEGAHCMMLPDAVYPTPLYEAFVCIVLFFVLWSVRKYFDTPGKLFSLYLLLNGFERFLIELVRVNNKIHFLGITATQAEIIAVVLMALGATGLLFFKKSKVQNQPT
jgi:prolipoprotein diacylglyceryltransferase